MPHIIQQGSIHFLRDPIVLLKDSILETSRIRARKHQPMSIDEDMVHLTHPGSSDSLDESGERCSSTLY